MKLFNTEPWQIQTYGLVLLTHNPLYSPEEAEDLLTNPTKIRLLI